MDRKCIQERRKVRIISGKHIYLDKFEELCQNCKGLGWIRNTNDTYLTTAYWCTDCKGKGKLNWIERVFVKENGVNCER